MDLDSLLEQTNSKMLSLSAGMNQYSEAILSYRGVYEQTLSIISESTEKAQQSINENRSIINQVMDLIGSFGDTANSKLDELDQKLSNFSESAQSIEQEITSRIIDFSESLATNTQSVTDISNNLISRSTNYIDMIQVLEDSFGDVTTAFDQLKDAVMPTIGSTVDTSMGSFEVYVDNLSLLKDLCSTKATELSEQFKSMLAVAESLSQDLLEGTKALNGDKLVLIESLISSDIVNKIAEGSSTLKDAAETLRSLGLDDIEKYATSIDEILEYTDKVNDIYDSIRPLIDLIA